MPRGIKKTKVEEEVESVETKDEDDGEEAANGEQNHLTAKDEIASEISEMISEYAGKRAGAKTTAVKACALVYQRMFEMVLRDGYFRFPNGQGALRVQDVKGGPRTVPRTGDRIMTPDRKKIVYQMGKNVKDVLNKGIPDSFYIDEAGNQIDPPVREKAATPPVED